MNRSNESDFRSPVIADPPSFSFLPAADEDFERLVGLRLRAMRESLERLGRYDPARARAWFAKGFRAADMRLIEVGGDVAGCVSVHAGPAGQMVVEHFYLEPALQGQGLGAAVMTALTAEADADGRAITLAVLEGSDANRFYVRFGFEETHREGVDICYRRDPTNRTL